VFIVNRFENQCLGTAAIACVWREVIEMTPTLASVLHKVLLVDDDDDVRAVMEATLQSRGFEVSTAEGVVEALTRIIRERHYERQRAVQIGI
jgi:hypothetical protein